MKILVKFPTRGRWNKFAETFHKYQTMKTTSDVTFLVTIDWDDTNMNRPEHIRNISQWGNVITDVIQPCGKIGAINAGLDKHVSGYDIILLASDDMIPIVHGYDQIIIDNMVKYYPDTDGILFFNDGYAGRNLNTLCILGRKYYERFGYIYHPSYKTLWCDNEFMDIGYMLGKQTYIDQTIIKHEQPINLRANGIMAALDALNVRDNSFYEFDKRNYHERKQRNFDLAINFNSDPDRAETPVEPTDTGNRPTNKRGRPRKNGTGVHPVR